MNTPAEAGALEERVLAVMRAERDRQMEFGCAPGDEDFAAVIASSLRVALAAAEERAERAERERETYEWRAREAERAMGLEIRAKRRQEEENTRFRAGLEPFAALADQRDQEWGRACEPEEVGSVAPDYLRITTVTLGMCRAARRALAAHTPEESDG